MCNEILTTWTGSAAWQRHSNLCLANNETTHLEGKTTAATRGEEQQWPGAEAQGEYQPQEMALKYEEA